MENGIIKKTVTQNLSYYASLKRLPSEEIHSRTLAASRTEKDATLNLLYHLQVVRDRRIYALKGYDGIWKYCMKELGYSESGTSERIGAMQLLEALPEIKEQFESGKMSLTTAAQVQTFVRKVQKEEKRIFSPEQKRELVQQVSGKSKREVERLFATISPIVALPRESQKPVTETLTQLTVMADEETMELLKRFQELKGQLSYNEILKLTLQEYLKKKDPMQKPQKEEPASTSELRPAAKRCVNSESRYIPVPIKSKIFKKAQGRCEYIDPSTQKRCDSKHRLQIDHIQPWSAGGKTEPANLRLLCQTHNALAAIQFFGEEKMKRWLG
mgnify:CR=1 FL=1